MDNSKTRIWDRLSEEDRTLVEHDELWLSQAFVMLRRDGSAIRLDPTKVTFEPPLAGDAEKP